MSRSAVRPATAAEIPAIGALIARSFDHLAANEYLVPPRADRVPVMRDFFTLYTGHALAYGRVDVVGDRGDPVAAAVWFDRTTDMPEPPDHAHRLASLAGEYLPNFRALDDLFDKYHPEEPHWHLAFLAVRPDRQNHGLGSALLRERHRELDRAGVPGYLEATNENNIRLYRRHGYTDMVPFDIPLPGGPSFYRMWRTADR